MSFYMKLRRIAKKPVLWLFRVCLKRELPAIPDGPLLICSNHISNADPLMLAVLCTRQITFLAKKELFTTPVVGWIVKKCGAIPLARDGGDSAALRQAIRLLQEGKVVMLFPQGKRCREPFENTEVKKGVGMLVALTKTPVLNFGIYAKKYRVRPFRKTMVVPGEIKRYEIPEGVSRKEETAYLSEAVYADIVRLSKEAEKAE